MILQILEYCGYFIVDRELILNQYKEHPGSSIGQTIFQEFINTAIQTLIFGIALYLILSTLSYTYFYINQKQKYLPKFKGNTFIKYDIILSLINIVVETFLVSILRVAIPRYSYIYYNLSDYSYSYFIFSIILHIIFDETQTYWTHRILHTNSFLYIKLHRYHHRSTNVTPFSGFAFHPLDAFLQAIPMFTTCFYFPVHINLMLTSSLLTTIWSISIHDNVPALPFKLFLYSTHHTIHHEPGRGGMKNFGKFTSIWDRIMGSYEDPDRIEFGWQNQSMCLSRFDRLNNIYDRILPRMKGQKIY